MIHKMFNNVFALCLKSSDDCCIFNDCPLFKECYPESYEKWLKEVKKESASARDKVK